MRLGAESDRIHAAGAEIIAISVDDEDRQAGMASRWPTPHVRYVSDPGGERYLRPLGLYDPDERGGIALPGLLVITPDAEEAYRHVGRDFADRTADEALLEAVESLGLDAIHPPSGAPRREPSGDLTGYFRPEHLVPYFKGNRFASIAIGGRLDDRAARAVARQHRLMCEATLAAWEQLAAH